MQALKVLHEGGAKPSLLRLNTIGSKLYSASNYRLIRAPKVLDQLCRLAVGADEAAVDRCWDLGILALHKLGPSPGD